MDKEIGLQKLFLIVEGFREELRENVRGQVWLQEGSSIIIQAWEHLRIPITNQITELEVHIARQMNVFR